MMRLRLLCIRYLFTTCGVGSFTTYCKIYGLKFKANKNANVIISRL